MKLRQIRKALKRNFMFPYQACLVRNFDDEVWCLAILTEFKDDYGHPLFYIEWKRQTIHISSICTNNILRHYM